MSRQDSGLRHISRRAGVVALVAVLIFVAALLQAGVLRDLFENELELRLILPDSGSSGLSAGAKVELLGTRVGTIQSVVLDPDASFYAIARIDAAMEPFIKVDSKAHIRKEFGFAGSSFLVITRGYSEPLDWDYAVLSVIEETGAADSVGALVEDLQTRIPPLLDDAQRTIAGLALLAESLSSPDGNLQALLGNLSQVSTRIAAGEGNVGRLLHDDQLVRDVNATVAGLRDTMASFNGIVANIQATTDQAVGMTAGLAEQTRKLPEMIDSTNATLRSLNVIMDEMGRTMPEVTAMVRNSAEASSSLPPLLTQTQQTLSELERLLTQLQGSWLLGGDGARRERVERLPSIEARQ